MRGAADLQPPLRGNEGRDPEGKRNGPAGDTGNGYEPGEAERDTERIGGTDEWQKALYRRELIL